MAHRASPCYQKRRDWGNPVMKGTHHVKRCQSSECVHSTSNTICILTVVSVSDSFDLFCNLNCEVGS